MHFQGQCEFASDEWHFLVSAVFDLHEYPDDPLPIMKKLSGWGTGRENMGQQETAGRLSSRRHMSAIFRNSFGFLPAALACPVSGSAFLFGAH
jgi:hypothetical protein